MPAVNRGVWANRTQGQTHNQAIRARAGRNGRTGRLLAVAVAALAVANRAGNLLAQSLTWDSSGAATNGGSAPTDGSGFWDSSNNLGNPDTFWYNGTSDTAWVNGDVANFGVNNGGAGTVTIDDQSGTVSASGINFNPTGGGSYAIVANTTEILTLTNSAAINLAGVNASIGLPIAGSAGLTLTGTGTLSLTNTNSTYSGTTNLNGGVLNFVGQGSIGAGPVAFNGGTLQYNINSYDVSSQGITLNAGGGTIDTFGNTVTFSSPIMGNGALTLADSTGHGTLSLASTSNTYQGGTNLNAGVLNFAGQGSLGTGPLTFNGGTLQFNGNNYDASSQGISLNAGGGTIDTNGNNVTFNSAISGTGGLTVGNSSGSGSLTLAVNNTYSGGTGVNSGATLIVGAAGNIGASTNTVAVGTSLGAVNVPVGSTAGTLVLPSGTTTIGSFTCATNSTGVNTLNIGGTLNVTGSNLSGAGTNAVFAVGSLAALSATPLNSLTTDLTITGGTLNVSGGPHNASFLADMGDTGNNSITTANGTCITTLNMVGLNTFVFTTGLGATPTGNPPTPAGNEFDVGVGISTNGITSLATNNTITAGTIDVGDTGPTPGAPVALVPGQAGSGADTLNLGSGTNILDANAILIGTGRETGTVGWATTATTGSVTIAGGAGGASTTNISIGTANSGTPAGTSNLNLLGHNATVQAGTVILGQLLAGAGAGKSTSTTGGAISFDTGVFNVATLEFAVTNGSNTSADSVAGTFNLGASGTSTGVLNVTSAFIIGDDTGGTSAGAKGTLAIAGGTANVFCNIIDESTAGTAGGTVTLSGGTLNMEGLYDIGTTAGGTGGKKNVTLTVPVNDTATIANLGGTGINDAGVIMSSPGTLVLDGTNNYTGSTSITSGTLQIGEASDTMAPTAPFILTGATIPDGSNLAFGSSQPMTMAGTVTGTGGLIQTGTGTTTLITSNTYSGTTTIAHGTLQIGNGGTVGQYGSGNVVDNGFLNFDRSDPVLTIPTTISGTGNVTQSGGGTLVLSGPNSYSGGTTIFNGTIKITNAGALGFGGIVSTSPGAANVAASSTLDLSGQTVTEPITLNGGTLTNSSASAAAVTSGVVGVGVISSTGGFTGDAAVAYNGAGAGATATPELGLSSASFTINTGGSYTVAPTCTISGGGGTGATAIAVLAKGTVSRVTVNNPGVGYTSAPTLTFSGTAITVATASGNATNFILDGIEETTAGSGYSSSPTATLTATAGTAVLGTPVISGINLAANSFIAGTGNISVAGDITGTGGLTISNTATVAFSGANTYTGSTTVNGGSNLVIAAAGSLPTGDSVTNNGTLAIDANSTAGQVTGTGTTAVANGVSFTSDFTQSALVNNGSTTLLGNSQVGQVTGSGALTLGDGTNSFTLALTGTNLVSTQKSLTINGGAIAGSTLDVGQNALLISDGVSPATAEAAIQQYVESGQAASTTNGAIISSYAATAGLDVAYADAGDTNMSGSKLAANNPGDIVIEAALPGDTDLNGSVNIHDLTNLLSNFNGPGFWDQGNFNGHTNVDISDLQALLTNFNTGMTLSYAEISGIENLVGQFGFEAIPNSNGQGFTLVSVPEPASVGLIAVAGVGLLTRRRKK
jgi:fibronectin-binding autotransporter adhesin